MRRFDVQGDKERGEGWKGGREEGLKEDEVLNGNVKKTGKR